MSVAVRARAAAITAVVLWGLAPVATRSLISMLPVAPQLIIRYAITSLLVIWWLPASWRRVPRRLRRRLVLVVASSVGYQLFVALGLRTVPASTGSLILSTEPTWILLICTLLLGQRAPRFAWAGLVLSVLGLIGIFGGHVQAGHSPAGLAMVLVAAISWAIYTVVVGPVVAEAGAGATLVLTTVFGTVLITAVLLPFAHFAVLAHLPALAWAELAFLIVFGTLLGVSLWNYGARHLGGAVVGPLLMIVPVVGVIAAALLLGERITLGEAGAGLLVLAGVAGPELARFRVGPPPPT